MEALQELLEQEICIDMRDHHDNTLLHLILNEPEIDTDVIKRLLDLGLDVNSRNVFGRSPLQHAVRNPDCDLDVIRMLLDRGASIDLQDSYGNSALHHILRNSDYNVVRMLIDRGADLNALNNDSDTPLNQAVNNSKWGLLYEDETKQPKIPTIDLLRAFLDRKPDVNLKNNFGDSPLHYAVNNCEDKQDIIRLLLTRGTNLNLVNNCGEASLHLAINSCEVDPDVVQLLLNFGADVEQRNFHGDHPLFLAVKNRLCSRSILKSLLEKGANVLACNRSGELPLRIAIQDYHQNDSLLDRVQLLMKYTVVSSLGFNISKLFKSTRNSSLLAKFYSDCLLEFYQMGREKVGVNNHERLLEPCAVTLYELLRGYQEVPVKKQETSTNPEKKEDRNRHIPKEKCPPQTNINYILKILQQKRFPIFQEVIVSKVKREDMVERLKTLTICTYVTRTVKGGPPPPKTKEEVVILDFYSVCNIAEYLQNEDLLNFIVAFHSSRAPALSTLTPSRILSQKRSPGETVDCCVKRFKSQRCSEEICLSCGRSSMRVLPCATTDPRPVPNADLIPDLPRKVHVSC